MHIEAKPTQPSDTVKKSYQAPELVVLGDAAEMTQAGAGLSTDGFVSDTAPS